MSVYTAKLLYDHCLRKFPYSFHFQSRDDVETLTFLMLNGIALDSQRKYFDKFEYVHPHCIPWIFQNRSVPNCVQMEKIVFCSRKDYLAFLCERSGLDFPKWLQLAIHFDQDVFEMSPDPLLSEWRLCDTSFLSRTLSGVLNEKCNPLIIDLFRIINVELDPLYFSRPILFFLSDKHVISPESVQNYVYDINQTYQLLLTRPVSVVPLWYDFLPELDICDPSLSQKVKRESNSRQFEIGSANDWSVLRVKRKQCNYFQHARKGISIFDYNEMLLNDDVETFREWLTFETHSDDLFLDQLILTDLCRFLSSSQFFIITDL